MLKKLAIICLGSFLIGIGINGFIIPFHLINGGMFGISLILNYLLGVKAGVTFIFLNLPVYLIALKLDRLYFINGLLGAIFSGTIIEVLMPLRGVVHLPIIESVMIGAGIIGTGIGIMLRHHISPGGMDLLALLVAKWSKINVGIIIYLLDTLIIMIGLFLLKDTKLLYSLLIVSIVGFFAYVLTTFRNIYIFTID